MNTPSGQPTPEDADRRTVGSAPLPQEFTREDDLDAARSAEFDYAPAIRTPPCSALLGDFLTLMERIEADFRRRWDVVQREDPMSAHRQNSHLGWPQSA
ncbi:hypothetical protein AB0M29_11525 [Streptomyces sp. NPDC051976]|uniref:hypothetical protein n=1 Tax=Streptomyces sp. NPDC051976 TaxID=3154947 RepID=UPI00344732C1